MARECSLKYGCARRPRDANRKGSPRGSSLSKSLHTQYPEVFPFGQSGVPKFQHFKAAFIRSRFRWENRAGRENGHGDATWFTDRDGRAEQRRARALCSTCANCVPCGLRELACPEPVKAFRRLPFAPAQLAPPKVSSSAGAACSAHSPHALRMKARACHGHLPLRVNLDRTERGCVELGMADFTCAVSACCCRPVTTGAGV